MLKQIGGRLRGTELRKCASTPRPVRGVWGHATVRRASAPHPALDHPTTPAASLHPGRMPAWNPQSMSKTWRLTLPVSLIILLFFSACATPPEGPSQGEARIVERIDRMESALLEHCGFDDVRSRAGLAAIGELRSRVQTLHEQVTTQVESPERVDCPGPLTTDAADEKLVLGRMDRPADAGFLLQGTT